MWIVTIDAVVTLAWPTAQIPVAFHAAVAAVFVVPVLGAMALGAELHDIGEVDDGGVCQSESFVVVRVVAAHAFERGVLKRHALVELFQAAGVGPLHVRFLVAVTGVAANHDRVSMVVYFSGVHHGHGVWLVNHGGVELFSRAPAFQRD